MIKSNLNRGYLYSLFLLLSFIPAAARSQKSLDSDSIWNILFVNKHYSIQITPGITSKAIFEKQDERYNVSSSPQAHFVLGFGYYSHISKEMSFITGLKFAVVGRNFNYQIPAAEFNPPLRGDIITNGAPSREYEFAYVALPLGLEGRWLRNKGYLNLNVGLNVCYGLQKGREWNLAGVLTPDWSGTIDYFEMPLNKDNENKPWLNYHLSGGYGRTLSNYNIIKANLHINFSNTAFMKGEYTFEVPGQPASSGLYKVKGSYVGIAVSYIFTRTKRTLERFNEREF